MIYEGGCHCGALSVALTSARAADDLPVRVCGCTFCLRHRPRYTSDPAGRVVFTAQAAQLSRYRLGLRLADFLICRTCGVFVGAHDPEQALAVVNLEALTLASHFTAAPTAFTGYDTEDAPARLARRARAWTPAELVVT